MTINIAEILVANSCGVSMVLLLLIFRIQNSETSRPDERLYNCMLIATLMALIAETASFLIDGKLFPGCFALQYICNTVCTGFTVLVGYLWNLFLEFKIYRSMKRLKNKALILGFPLFAVACGALGEIQGKLGEIFSCILFCYSLPYRHSGTGHVLRHFHGLGFNSDWLCFRKPAIADL